MDFFVSWLGNLDKKVKTDIAIPLARDVFFLIGIHSIQGWTATMRHGVTRKEA